MNWQIRYEVYNGKVADSIRDSICMYRFGHRMRGTGLLIEQLVGIAIEAMGYAEIFNVLDRTAVSTTQLEKLQEVLQAGRNDTVINMEAEKAMFYDLIQRQFTDDGEGGGRPIRAGSGFAGKSPGEIIFNILRFNLPDRKEAVAHVDKIYEYYQQCFETADFERSKQQFNQAIESSPLLIKILTPAIEKIAELSWRLRTHSDGLIATIAILRYKGERGRYPESLDELLQEGFLQEMPFDFYRSGPLTYRKTEDSFILYSLGQDRDDDGGTPSKWGTPPEGGDQVFWPVQK